MLLLLLFSSHKVFYSKLFPLRRQSNVDLKRLKRLISKMYIHFLRNLTDILLESPFCANCWRQRISRKLVHNFHLKSEPNQKIQLFLREVDNWTKYPVLQFSEYKFYFSHQQNDNKILRHALLLITKQRHSPQQLWKELCSNQYLLHNFPRNLHTIQLSWNLNSVTFIMEEHLKQWVFLSFAFESLHSVRNSINSMNSM